MKKSLILLILIPLCGISLVNAQRVVQVAPGVGSLNDAIDGDTTAAGARTDLNTIYELQDGGVYKLTRSIENIGKGSDKNPYPLHIRAAAGAVTRPFLQPTVPSGGSSDRCFRLRANTTLEGIRATNEDDLGTYRDQTLRISSDNVRLIVRDCFFEKDAQTLVRCDGANPKLYFYGTTVAFMGRPSSMDNGRFIDPRDSNIDTVVVEDCAIYGITSRFFRNGNGRYNYVKIDQSTFANSGQRAFNFADINELYFTNNIIMNGAFLGRDEIDGDRAIFELEALPGPDTSIVRISHNNYFITPDMAAEYTADPIRTGPLFLDSITNVYNPANLTSTNFIEVINFDNGLASVLPIWTEFVLNGYNGTAINAPWTLTGTPHSFVYSQFNGPVSAAGGTTGQPVGQGMLKPTSIDRTMDALRLKAYPNPAQDVFYIDNQDLRSWKQIRVFDLTGKVVMKIEQFRCDQLTLSTGDLPNGTYLVKLTDAATNHNVVVRMVKSASW
jgi:hypothetical protein